MEKSKIRNKIITISGEPVSGKGTVVKELTKKLQDQGYVVHKLGTGDIFRGYYDKIKNFVIALQKDDQQKIEELSQSYELKQLFSSEENRRKIMKLVTAGVDMSNFQIEDANNDPVYNEVTAMLDGIIDSSSKQLGIEINSQERPGEVWIIDSRLAFYNIPDAFAVRLTANKDVGGKWLYKSALNGERGEEDRPKNLTEAIKAREARRVAEIRRYAEKYGIDITDENYFDVLIDASYASVSDTAEVILGASKRYYDDKPFAKKWSGVKEFVPTQGERDTLGEGSYSTSLEETRNSIRADGYHFNEPIEVIEVDGIKYIYEGHHRNFALPLSCQKENSVNNEKRGTLIPYEVIARDDENIPGTQNTARQRAESVEISYLYGHEALIEQGLQEKFSYKDIHPELVAKLQEKEASKLYKNKQETAQNRNKKESPDEDEFPM